MNEQSKEAMDLLHKGFEAGRTTNVAEAQEKVRELWETTLGVLRTNIHFLLKTQSPPFKSGKNLPEAWPAPVRGQVNRGRSPGQSERTYRRRGGGGRQRRGYSRRCVVRRSAGVSGRA